MPKTIAQMNADVAAWIAANPSPYALNKTTTYGVGKSGSSCHGSTGAKTHVIITTTYLNNIPSHALFGKTMTSVSSPCNSTDRRQASFSIIEGLDTDKVTCTKCLKWLGV